MSSHPLDIGHVPEFLRATPEPGVARTSFDEGEGATHSILEEAHQLTHGDRNKTYGHPYDDYSCTAQMASAILAPKLKEPITAHEMALLMCCVKISRESRVSKRDNLVDLAGYAWVAQVCRVEQGKQPIQTTGDIVK